MSRIVLRVCLCITALLCGCDATDRLSAPGAEPQLLYVGNPDILVQPGGSIQAAVDAATPGAVIHIMPGTYYQEVTVTKAGLRIIGIKDRAGNGVVLENPGSFANGFNVRAGGDGFTLANVTVRGYTRNGVFLIGIQDFLISRVTAEDNGAYGIYPIRSARGVVEHSIASGHADAGFYVGQAQSVTMRNNTAFRNVVGIEISNSSDIRLLDSHAHDNSAGILVALLPGRAITTLSDILVSGNRVQDNNRPNFAPPTDLVAAVPAGSGILVVGGDRVKVEANTVTGHDFIGIGVGSSALLAALAGLPAEVLAGIEPNPDGVRVRNNTVTGNGVASPIPFVPAVDLFWDGTGTGNCWSNHGNATSFPSPLPGCSD